MANQDKLIRPAIINIPPNPSTLPPNPSTASTSQNAQFEENIRRIVTRVCTEQCRSIVESILNPNAEISGTDQGIDERFRDNLTELDKVPDVVRCLREFSGNNSEFSSWKKSVERVLNLYESSRGTPKYFSILNVIRNKITGAADAALESYNTPLNWESISRCLALHYADKRDLGTLEYQMTTLVQNNNSVQDFYQEVYSHLSLIINNISCMTIGREAMDTLIQTYRDKALDTFIRGLRGDLSKLLCIREPTTLPQALHLCLKLQNQNFRTEHAHNKNTRNLPIQSGNNRAFKPQNINRSNNFSHRILQFPETQHNMNHPYTHTPPQYFNYKQQIYNQRQFPNQFQGNPNNNPRSNIPPPRPIAPKPLPKPEPMDIDRSMQTRAVNYMNRPRPNIDFAGKRPLEQFSQQPRKFQRNFHIETNGQDFNNQDCSDETYNEQINTYSLENNLQDFQDYIEEEEDSTNNLDFVDIHFLE